MAKRIYTESQLNAICKDLQQWLRLQDWEVTVKLVHHQAMHTEMAQIDLYSYSKVATISIPSPETYAMVIEPEQDMLKSLIHELLHLHGTSFFPNGAREPEQYADSEFMLNAIAACLCDAYDGTQRKEPTDGTDD